MMAPLRKSLSEASAPRPEPKFQTLLAHFSNSVSWVTPRSSVMASYSVRPGDLRLLEGSPPSRCLTTSVVRLSAPTLLTPATYRPSHLTRNLKFLYGSNRCALTVNCAIVPPLHFDLAGHLLNLDDHELGGLERRKPDQDVDNTQIDVVLRGGLFVALDEVGFARRAPLKGALPEEVLHERANVEPDLRPKRLVVRLEDHPLRAAIKALFDEERRAPHWDVFPLGSQAVGAVQGARAPYHATDDRKRPQAVDAEWIQFAVFIVRQRHTQLWNADEAGFLSGRRFPYAALRVCAREYSGHGAARNEFFDLVIAQRIGLLQAREEDRRILAIDTGDAGIIAIFKIIERGLFAGPTALGIHNHHCAPFSAIRDGLRNDVEIDVVRRRIRRNAQQIEKVGLL